MSKHYSTPVPPDYVDEQGEQGEQENLFIDKSEEAEAAFWRLKRAADRWREDRIRGVLAQEGERLHITLGRVLYLIGCILFDGLILTEIPLRLGKTIAAWALFGVALGFAIMLQRRFYDDWFVVDISQIDLDQQ